MEKGLIEITNKCGVFDFYSTPLLWYSDKTIKEHENFPKSLSLKRDLAVRGTMSGDSTCTDFEAYRCGNCGAILIIPPEDKNKDI